MYRIGINKKNVKRKQVEHLKDQMIVILEEKNIENAST